MRITPTLDAKKLKEGQIIVYKNNNFELCEITSLLPELNVLNKKIENQNKKIEELKQRMEENEVSLIEYKQKINKILEAHHIAIQEISKDDC